LRGTVLGFLVGLIPGPAATIASFVSYGVEKKISRHRDELGTGAIEGVAGPEAANNAAAGGGMIPLLSLGLPFTPSTAPLVIGLVLGPVLERAFLQALTIARGEVSGLWASGPAAVMLAAAAVAFVAPAVLALARRSAADPV